MFNYAELVQVCADNNSQTELYFSRSSIWFANAKGSCYHDFYDLECLQDVDAPKRVQYLNCDSYFTVVIW